MTAPDGSRVPELFRTPFCSGDLKKEPAFYLILLRQQPSGQLRPVGYLPTPALDELDALDFLDAFASAFGMTILHKRPDGRVSTYGYGEMQVSISRSTTRITPHRNHR